MKLCVESYSMIFIDVLDLFKHTINLMNNNIKDTSATSNKLNKCDLAIAVVEMTLQSKSFSL